MNIWIALATVYNKSRASWVVCEVVNRQLSNVGPVAARFFSWGWLPSCFGQSLVQPAGRCRRLWKGFPTRHQWPAGPICGWRGSSGAVLAFCTFLRLPFPASHSPCKPCTGPVRTISRGCCFNLVEVHGEHGCSTPSCWETRWRFEIAARLASLLLLDFYGFLLDL